MRCACLEKMFALRLNENACFREDVFGLRLDENACLDKMF